MKPKKTKYLVSVLVAGGKGPTTFEFPSASTQKGMILECEKLKRAGIIRDYVYSIPPREEKKHGRRRKK